MIPSERKCLSINYLLMEHFAQGGNLTLPGRIRNTIRSAVGDMKLCVTDSLTPSMPALLKILR